MIIRAMVLATPFLIIPVVFAAEQTLKSGISKTNSDPAVRAQDDLFRHVNGKWLKESRIPADRPADGAFYELRDLSEKRVRAIIEEAAKSKDGPDAKKIDDLFASFMDEKRAEQLGMSPIQSELDSVAKIKDKQGLLREIAALQRVGVGGLFGIYVGPDSKKSDQYIVHLAQVRHRPAG